MRVGDQRIHVSGVWQYAGGPPNMTQAKANHQLEVLRRLSAALRPEEAVQSIDVTIDAHHWQFRRGA